MVELACIRECPFFFFEKYTLEFLEGICHSVCKLLSNEKKNGERCANVRERKNKRDDTNAVKC